MRIALVTETYPPEVNGVAMTLSRLTGGLARRGHTVRVVRPTQAKPPAGPPVGPPQITVPGFPLPGYDGLRFGFPDVHLIQSIYSGYRPDVVHVATEGPLGFTAVEIARARDIPVTSGFHTNFHAYGRHYGYGAFHWVALAYLRHFHNRTHLTVVPSDDQRESLQQSGFANLRILGRGVDTTLFNPARRDPQLRASWGADDSTPVAIYVGRIAAEKNIPLTIRSFLHMRDSRPDMKLVLVGDGPARQGLEVEHPEFHFAGMRRGEDLARHYASGDIFLFGSITETFGNVVTEAMASGLAVLAYNYAAARTFIRPGENGITVPLGNEDAFLRAAQQLANHPSLIASLRQQARKTALSLSWDHVIENFEKLLASAPVTRPPS